MFINLKYVKNSDFKNSQAPILYIFFKSLRRYIITIDKQRIRYCLVSIQLSFGNNEKKKKNTMIKIPPQCIYIYYFCYIFFNRYIETFIEKFITLRIELAHYLRE